MSTVIRGRIPEHATLRYQEESVDDVQIPYDITFKLVGYESVQIEKQIKAISPVRGRLRMVPRSIFGCHFFIITPFGLIFSQSVSLTQYVVLFACLSVCSS